MGTQSAAWWREVLEVADRALELASAERTAYLEQVAVRDRAMGSAAAAVLRGADAAVVFERSAAGFAAPLVPGGRHVEVLEGAEIGSYRLLREIGRGGMGSVYLAERADDQFRKRVAVKLLSAWSAGDPNRVRRFLEERQILAALDHPNIARLLDGGVTAGGLPWFAMEYVEGVPIDRHCDDRCLSVEARLELFRRVCDAVQYAHRNLVVHRDLKPGNILVTGEGQVKLLDFGIAKLLSSDGTSLTAPLTITGERVMTPQYASPEQIRGDAVSTATDVYALGVLLYELVTGRYPYRPATREPHDLARAILVEEPERPSAAVARSGGGVPAELSSLRGLTPAKLERRLHGDLDTIALTAMSKDPGRRYGTAEQLEADVVRHLRGLPLEARPESGLQRGLKFARRHRIGVASAAGVTVLILGFATLTTVQSVRIRGQAARISSERDRAEQVSRFLGSLFEASDPYAGAAPGLTAREILDSGAARVKREVAMPPEVRARMMFAIGRAYFGLGSYDPARLFLETSLAIRRQLEPADSIAMAQTLDTLGVVRLAQGEWDGAERAYREALDLRRRMSGAGRSLEARTLNGLAAVLRAAGRFRSADSVSRRAIQIDEAQPVVNRWQLAESLKGLGHARQEAGDHRGAVQLYERALSLQREQLPVLHAALAGTMIDLAAALGDAGREARADSLFREGLSLERRALGEDHSEVARDEVRHARLLRRLGRGAEAEALNRRALATMRRRLPEVHPLTATALLGLGELLSARGATEQAEKLISEAFAMRQTSLPPGHPGRAEAEQAMGAVIMARGRYLEAERLLLPSRDSLRAAYGDADPRARAALSRLVQLYESSGQPARAADYRKELETVRP